jgi:hypothetical protein
VKHPARTVAPRSHLRLAAFLGIAAVAAAEGLVVWLLLNETRPAKYDD